MSHDKHVCPSYCHQCPLLRNAIMPMCYGTIWADDDLDLSRCTCIPGDPATTASELAELAWRMLQQLRDARRFRLVRHVAVKRLRDLQQIMKNASEDARAQALDVAIDIANTLAKENPPPTLGELAHADAVVTRRLRIVRPAHAGGRAGERRDG